MNKITTACMRLNALLLGATAYIVTGSILAGLAIGTAVFIFISAMDEEER